MDKPLPVINLYGGPGTGKSTIAAYVFAKLKEAGVNCEYIQEFAKDKTWEENPMALACQPYISGKQFWRLFRMRNQVQMVVTDSPILLALLYPGWGCNMHWENGLVEMFHGFSNINIFLKRNTSKHPYNPKGRKQSEEQAREIDAKTRAMLDKHGISYHEIEVDDLDQVWRKVRVILQELGHNIPIPAQKAWFI